MGGEEREGGQRRHGHGTTEDGRETARERKEDGDRREPAFLALRGVVWNLASAKSDEDLRTLDPRPGDDDAVHGGVDDRPPPCLAGPQPFDGALEHHLAAVGPRPRAEVDDVIGYLRYLTSHAA